MKNLDLRMLFIACIFMLSQAVSNTSNAQCDPTDWQALQALYVNAGGAGWTNNAGWNQVAPPLTAPPAGCDLSTMYGVILDNTGRVQKLTLTNNQFTGFIPPDIGNLSNLTVLSFSGGQLTGGIPPAIGNLTNLTTLNLNDLQLTGTIPTQLWDLINVTQLSLRDNQLTGSLPSDIGDLTGLSSLSLQRNMLSGNLPPELWTLTNLGALTLSTNQFTGSIPSDIGNLTNLTNLYLSQNQFTGPIPSEIGNLNLSNLRLSNNQFTGSIPNSFAVFTNLFQFSVSNNQLSGCYDPALTPLCVYNNIEVSSGNNFDAPWEDYCMFGMGVCAPPACAPIAQVEVETGDVYIDDACHGVILTSPNGTCYRLRVEDDGSFTSEMVACP